MATKEMKWYVVKTISGKEEKVKKYIQRELELNKMNWSIDAISADTGYSRRQISRVINGHTKN